MTSPMSRPLTFGECISLGLGTTSRLCPHAECRYHTGSAPQTCTLRLAERDGMTAHEVAAVLGIDRTRVRQIEARALAKIRDGRAPTWLAARERAA